MTTINHPRVWQHLLPRPQPDDHKYNRGHAVVFAATELTGATRLASQACSCIGAGLVSVLATRRADIYRATLPPDIMVSEEGLWAVKKPTALLAGPGGLADAQRNEMYEGVGNCVRIFDTDAIPTTGDWHVLDKNCVLTPHDGEFQKTFPGLASVPREDMALKAANLCGATIVLKGRRTIIAAPDGQSVINEHATMWLAKAGTGDTLAGMITGLTAQGMDVFNASCAAVWMHGEAGRKIGPGLIAGDIAGQLPNILARLYNDKA